MKLKSIGVSIVAFFVSFIAYNQSWNVTTMTNMPMKVSNNGVVGANVGGINYIYSFGGIDSTKLSSGIHLKSFRYNTQLDVWDTIPNLPDTLGKIALGTSVIDSIIYIMGGYHVYAGGGEASSNLVHRFNVNSNSFLPNGDKIPVPIDDHVQVVWRDSLIYLVTGWSNTTNVPNV